MTTTVDAAAGVDADLARLVDTLGGISDGDLHRAQRGGGWTVAQVSPTSTSSTLVWLGDLRRLEPDPDLRFFFREEIGHDALGYPPPTVEIALARLGRHPPHPRDLPARDVDPSCLAPHRRDPRPGHDDRRGVDPDDRRPPDRATSSRPSTIMTRPRVRA